MEQTSLYRPVLLQQHGAIAVAKISKLAGYAVSLDEYWPGYYRVADMPPTVQEEVARQLEREVQVLTSMGGMAQYSITLGDKLRLYRTVVDAMQALPREELDTAITWAQFKARLNKMIREECAKPIELGPGWLSPRAKRKESDSHDDLSEAGGDGAGSAGPVCGGRQPQDPAAE